MQQLEDIQSYLPGYEWVGEGRLGGKANDSGEFMAVFYDTNRFEALEHDNFWLSETPDVPGSTSWEASQWPRMVTWVRFLDNMTEDEFYFVNTQFDHASAKAREKSAELIVERMKSFDSDLPIFLAGYFNTGPATTPYEILINQGSFVDLWETADMRIGEGLGTYNAFNDESGGGPEKRVDWIMAKGAITADKIEIVDYRENGAYLSDHYPVVADVRINSEPDEGSENLNCEPTTADQLRIMSYNVAHSRDWDERAPLIQKQLECLKPDIIGTQEGVMHQLEDLDRYLPEYEWIGDGRLGGRTDESGEFMAIYYDANRFDVLEFENYWLSDTPEIPGSITWEQSKYPRMVTWIRFLDNTTGNEFYFVNTHLDHVDGGNAREKSAELIIERSKDYNPNLPIFLTGDFNASPGTVTHEKFKSYFVDLWETADTRIGEGLGTFNGYSDVTGGGPEKRIDWILAKGPIVADKIEIVDYRENGAYLSDHYPVLADVRINSEPDNGSDNVSGLWFSGEGKPDDNVGDEEDFYLDITNGNVYQKSVDGWKLIGHIKDEGVTWQAGEGKPRVEDGKVGDLYLDTSTGSVYRKSTEGWNVITNLKGDKDDPDDKDDPGDKDDPSGKSDPSDKDDPGDKDNPSDKDDSGHKDDQSNKNGPGGKDDQGGNIDQGGGGDQGNRNAQGSASTLSMGKGLPNTATNNPLFILIGTLMIITGGLFVFIRKKFLI